MDDWQLLRSYASDDSQDAFTEIVTRHVNLVYSAALRQVCEAELARDVTQVVFANLARQAKSLKPKGTLAGWLYRDASFTSRDVLRRERRRFAREQEAVAMQDAEMSRDWRQIQPRLDAALSQLGQIDRDAVLLRFFEQRNLKEIGSVLGMEEDSARKRVSRALEKLRMLLAREGITTTDDALSGALTGYAVQAAPAGLAAGILATSLAGGSAAAATGTTTLIELFAMTTKLKATIAAIAVAASIGTPLFMQHAEIKSLRDENQALVAQASQFAALQSENERLSNRVAQTAAVDNTISDEQRAELNRLRAEVARLRATANEAQQLRQELSRLRSPQRPVANAAQPDNFPRESWAFAGYATPESTMQSLAWAALQGDVNTFLNSMSPDRQSEQRREWEKNGKDDTQVRDRLTREFGGTKAIRIDGRQPISDDEVVLSMFIERENGRGEKTRVKLQRIDNQWKIAETLDSLERVEPGATLEVVK